MNRLRLFHRYIGLSLALVWSVQILSGVISVFHREIDAALLVDEYAVFDRAQFAAAVEQLRQDRSPDRLSSVYAAAMGTSQFDVFLHAEDGLRVLRLDGLGNVLREQPWGFDVARVSFLQNVRLLHETLLAGSRADLLVGLSGVFLLGTLILGLRLGWPRPGQWRRALFPAVRGSPPAKLRNWHRALGLWFAAPALVIVAAGILTVWEDAVGRIVGGYAPEPAGTARAPITTEELPFGTALDIAVEAYPKASISIVNLPTHDQPWYRIRLRQPGEVRRLFGMTTLYIRADSGAVIARYDPYSMTAARRAANAIYAIHTGVVGGWPTRVLSFLTGVAVLVSMTIGIVFWTTRRQVVKSGG